VLDGLAYVLRNAAPGLRLIAASRMDPLLPLHRYRLAGELAEVRAGDLAFSVAESALLLAQHGIDLPGPAIESLTRRAEGWAAGLRLAAISLEGHPDPAQFVKEFAAEDSSITGYLVEEVLDAQPAPVRDLLLRTSILTRVSAEVADELTEAGDAAASLPELARTNAFVRPVGNGCYRYHALFASMLRLKLRRERPGQFRDLHRRAAGWYRRNGSLGEAVRHAAEAGDWQLAGRIVVDELAIGQLIDPRGARPLTDEFRRMPAGTQPEVLLVTAAMTAAMELAGTDGQPDRAALGAADSILENRPAGADIPARLAAALVRVAFSRRAGDHAAAAGAAARAEALLRDIPSSELDRHPGVRIEVLSARGIAEFWAGGFDQAAGTLRAASDAAAPESTIERAGCLGNLALVEALRGQLDRAGELAGEALSGQPASPAVAVALACVHLDRGEFREARTQLKVAEEALGLRPDPLAEALARAVAVRCSLGEGHLGPARVMLDRVPAGPPLPAWLGHRMSLLESCACAAEGAAQAAVDAAESAAPRSHLDAAVALAQAWLAAGNPQAARSALALPGAGAAASQYAQVEAWLVDARLSYRADDRGRGYRSLGQALRLASPEQLRLPLVMGRSWIRPVLRQDPRLARAYQSLLQPILLGPGPAPASPPGDAPPLIVEQLSEREREVIRYVSDMMSTAEIAAEMYISVNTVKTHLKSIYRKLSAAHRREAVRRARQLHLV
jgi:LuxR family maltose regulon positive regulatory protein